MSARSKARKRALDMLYIADVRQVPISEILGEEARRAAAAPQRASSWPYAEQIVSGVNDSLAEIDALIEQHAVGWTLARMPVVDRAILRLATWELRENPDIPTAVEAGLAGYEAVGWMGLYAPKGTPLPLRSRLAAEVAKAMASPDILARLEGLGFQAKTDTPPQFDAYLKAEKAKWAKVVKDAGVPQE